MQHSSRKISGSTLWYKKLFPVVWFGFLGSMTLIMILPVAAGDVSPMGVVIPVVMAVFGYFMFRNLVWDLCDEVFDAGEELIFIKGDKKQHVKLSDIINISYNHMMSPERVVINSRVGGAIGKELVFCLPKRFMSSRRIRSFQN